MDASTKHAWILLAIPARGAAVNEISVRAMFLNNGAPSDLDLHESLRWLDAAALISVDGDVFRRTSAGQQVVEEEWNRESMIETWRAIGLRLAKTVSPNT